MLLLLLRKNGLVAMLETLYTGYMYRYIYTYIYSYIYINIYIYMYLA